MSNDWMLGLFNINKAAICGCALALVVLGSGCKSPDRIPQAALDAQAAEAASAQAAKAESLVLHEGDAIRITFPGAPSLNALQQIRRDGLISLQQVGEIKAAGLTPTQLQEELLKLYGPQLQTKEVTVQVESSAYPVYITGAVLRPGKIVTDRPINALEGVMEAGGFDYTRANTKEVRVIRYENGEAKHYTVNLKKVLRGQTSETFPLKPYDILYVPQRFTWF